VIRDRHYLEQGKRPRECRYTSKELSVSVPLSEEAVTISSTSGYLAMLMNICLVIYENSYYFMILIFKEFYFIYVKIYLRKKIQTNINLIMHYRRMIFVTYKQTLKSCFKLQL